METTRVLKEYWFDSTPIPAPRMVHSDKWKKRPEVQRYKAFRDEIRWRAASMKCEIPPDVGLVGMVFYMPMPKSWSKAKRESHNGQYHRQTPDIDNLVKAFLDSLCGSDAHVAEIRAVKIWTHKETGRIRLTLLEINE